MNPIFVGACSTPLTAFATGSVFRVSPNELSFASVESWRAIYGFPPTGQEHLVKSEFYDIYGAGFKTGCIGSERDPRKHALKKKNLAAAFSTQALNSQEALVQHCWDGFVTKVGYLSQRRPNGIDVVKWLEMATFDILGEMAFGESFHCVEEGNPISRVRPTCFVFAYGS